MLTGNGLFQVNDEVFPIEEGSMRNTSSAPMTYICLQAKADSHEACTMGDADITERDSLM